MKRVTVTLPERIIDEIDFLESNRSRFIAEAAQRELLRRRRKELRRSLSHPHPETLSNEEMGIQDWGDSSGADDEALVDSAAGHDLRWKPGKGWTESVE